MEYLPWKIQAASSETRPLIDGSSYSRDPMLRREELDVSVYCTGKGRRGKDIYLGCVVLVPLIDVLV